MKRTFYAIAIATAISGCSDSGTDTTTTPVADTVETAPVASTPVASEPVETTPAVSTPVASIPVEAEPVATVDTCAVSTGVGIAFQSVDATVTSSEGFGPENLIDGCLDRSSSWSGDNGSIVTLDAGSAHQMQGVYLTSTFSRMELIRLETSSNGLDWVTDFNLIPTKPVSGPVYYPFLTAGSKRFVRITGFGSDVNSFVNIAEARWSLSGFSVQGDRVLRDTNAGSYEGVSHSRHDLLQMTSHQASVASGVRQRCDYGQEFSAADITGSGDEFITNVVVNGRKLYFLDWGHYPYLTGFVDTFTYVLEPLGDYASHIESSAEYLADPFAEYCVSSGLGDASYGSANNAQELLGGVYPPNNSNWQ